MYPTREVALLSMHYPPEPTGNAPYMGALASRLNQAGFRVTAHVTHPHYPEWSIRKGYGQWKRSEQIDGVRVVRRRHYVPQPPRGVRRLLSELSFGVRLLFAPMARPQVVIAVSPALFSSALAVLRCRLTFKRPRIVVWVQDIYTLGLSETNEGGRFARGITRWVESRTLTAADRVVVIHQRFADYLIQTIGVPAERVSVVRNWTHLPPAQPRSMSEAKAVLGWPDDATVVVHAGNMGAKQGLENVVDAARIADQLGSPVLFILLGEGGERKRLEKYAEGVSRLIFLEPLDDENFRTALRAADILIVNEKPGVAAMALPAKLTSYFDAGRPVIAATDLDGITASEIEISGAGVVVKAGEPEALLSAVLSLREHPVVAEQYGANGRRHREAVLGENVAVGLWTEILVAT